MMARAALLALAVAGACGRIGFDARVGSDAANPEAPDSAASAITYVQPFIGHGGSAAGVTDTFTVSAAQAGDAVVIHLFCQSATKPTAVSITASGWSFTQLGIIAGSADFWATSVGAIAPDSAPAGFTVTWAGTSSCIFLDELGDELAGADPAGGTTTFDGHDEVATTGNCTAMAIAPHAGDAVWNACTTDCVASVGSGFTKGADDGHCDWSEYRLARDPGGTSETAGFATTAQSVYVDTLVTIKPQ